MKNGREMVSGHEGQQYEEPPKAMIVDGILRCIFGSSKEQEESYVFPDNLRRFFCGKDKVQDNAGCGCYRK